MVEKQSLSIGVSFSIPPWVIKESDSGIELDILNLAFQDSPYEIELVYAPFAYVHKLFDAERLDGYINAKHNPEKKGYLSETVVTFQNVAISLASKGFPGTFPIDFLQDKQVVAFQKASLLLGTEFERMSQKNPDYQEIAKQSLQINLLYARGIDFIVMDRSIFGYYRNEAIQSDQGMTSQYDYFKPITIHPIFPSSPYAYRFANESVRDTFDHGLQKLKESGRFDQILKNYDHLSQLKTETP